MSRFKTNYSGLDVQEPGEINNEPSMTVPDQSMSLSEMVRRYASGLPVKGARVPLYEDTDDDDFNESMPDLSRMDRAEAAYTMEQVANQVHDIRSRFKPKPKPKPEPEKSKAPEKSPETPNQDTK